MIEAVGLTKRYGRKTAVDDVSFTVKPGLVTGFLGPNGAGKSTTMRLIVGLDRPTAGDVTVSGKHYSQLRAPLREVGVLLDAKAVHTGRTAREPPARARGDPRHPRDARRRGHRAGRARVGRPQAGRRLLARHGQRLGIAAALLGDPATLILDEPVNGLDPEGVIWVRNLVRHLAAEGRTVFLSSHLMSEMAQTADHIIVLGRGRVIADAPVASILAKATGTGRAGADAGFGAARAAADRECRQRRPSPSPIRTCSRSPDLSAPQIGELAARTGHHPPRAHAARQVSRRRLPRPDPMTKSSTTHGRNGQT